MKLVDAVVPPRGNLIKTAKDWIKAGGKAVAPWDVEGFKLPGGPVYSKAGMMMFAAGQRHLSPRDLSTITRPRAPSCSASTKACNCRWIWRCGSKSRWFAKILRSPEAAAMIRSLFVSMQELNKGARRPANVPPSHDQEDRHASAPASWAPASRYVSRAGRHRRRADRPRPGDRRQGQGACRNADRPTGRQGPRHGAAEPRRAAGAHHRRPPTTLR